MYYQRTDVKNIDAVFRRRELLYSSHSRTVTPGLLHFWIFLRIFAKFRKNTPKNTSKTEKVPGLLHFFDIFFVTVRESLLYQIAYKGYAA